MYASYDKVRDNISAAPLKLFLNAKLSELRQLHLGKYIDSSGSCQIGDEGVQVISAATTETLSNLSLLNISK